MPWGCGLGSKRWCGWAPININKCIQGHSVRRGPGTCSMKFYQTTEVGLEANGVGTHFQSSARPGPREVRQSASSCPGFRACPPEAEADVSSKKNKLKGLLPSRVFPQCTKTSPSGLRVTEGAQRGSRLEASYLRSRRSIME